VHIKSKYAWIKHFDFMVIDLLSLLLSFVLAYFYKFKNFNLFYSSSWMILLSMAVLLGAVITLFINPYSGILRRRYYEELLNCGLLAIYNFLLITLLLFISKSSADFSREVLLVAYALYILQFPSAQVYLEKAADLRQDVRGDQQADLAPDRCGQSLRTGSFI
jgi:undecaprenyl-phosphate galactose phosphotransferase